MSREKSEAFIYRIVKYSDSSAIAMAFSKDYGKLKLFVPKAYTKKGGIMAFMPGTLDFGKKQTDLHRYYAFEPDTTYYKFINNHDIIMRLHLVFEILDGLFHTDILDDKLFDLLKKIDDTNFRKITPYIIYFMLKRSGVMFDTDSCVNCASDEDLYTVTKDGIYCSVCSKDLSLSSCCDKESSYIIKCFGHSQLYRNLTVTRKQEIQVLTALCGYAEQILEKPLKSLKTVFEIIR